MISFLTPLATDGIGYAYGFVFVATNIAGVLLVYFFLYESVSLSLENVDLMYSQPALKPWNSRRWMPPGYTTRMQRDEAYFDNHGASTGVDDLDDRTTAVPSGRPSRAADEEKKMDRNNDFGPTESREEKVNRAV